MSCPKCDSARTEVRETKKLVNGTRRRRHGCLLCGHRWTSWDGPRPTRQECAKTRRPPATRKVRARIGAEEVRFALVRMDLNNVEVGRELGCSHETVRQIRNGQLYATIHPELLRPNDPKPRPAVAGPSCDKCGHWAGDRCGFGFPDPLTEGLLFASDCDLYEVSQSISRACPSSDQ